MDGGEGGLGTVPVFTMFRLAGAVPSLAPVASPGVRRRPSPLASSQASLSWFEVAAHMQPQAARATARPISTRFEPVPCLRRFNHWFTRVTPICLASRARAVWQYRHDPSLSRLLSALPRTSGVRLPPASPDCCDSPAEGPYTPPGNTAPHGARPPHEMGPWPAPPAGNAGPRRGRSSRRRRRTHA